MADKKTLRKLYLEKRKSISLIDAEKYTESILKHFSELSFNGVEYVHLYYPIAGKAEFDTLKLASWLRSNHPEIKLVLPKSDLINHSLTHLVWDADTMLSENKWGITEPESGEEIQPTELDLVIVPLLVYDIKGNRIGYGKGFYDRFLATCKPNVKKIGVSFFPPEDAFEGVDEFDIPLNVCITPDKVWRFV